ncbi:MAG: hypothetical protein AB1473_14465 [Thermodesulfobacteriota bacterium]
MPRSKETAYKPAELIQFEPSTEITLLPPNSGVIGRFLEETANMFKARAMRMGGLLRRINESGQRTEAILRTAAERMEAAEAKLEQDMCKEGLLPDTGNHNELEDD